MWINRCGQSPRLDDRQTLPDGGLELHFADLCRASTSSGSFGTKSTWLAVSGSWDEPDPGAPVYACDQAYVQHLDPATLYPYTANPSGMGGIGYPTANHGTEYEFPIPAGYVGFDPTQPAINNGEGFAKPLGGNKLPNAPPFTASFGAQYTVPITSNWAGTLRGDYYWQDYSWARVFNDNPYDRLRGYTNVNLSLIFTNQNGWQVMGYLKNVFDTTAITGAFLNSDDSELTTNVFLTDPQIDRRSRHKELVRGNQ